MDRPGRTPEESTDEQVQFCEHIDVVEIRVSGLKGFLYQKL